MEHFPEFSIPVKGLSDGEYQYAYQLDSSFFAKFEDAPLTDANLKVDLQLDKRSSMMLMSMQLSGTMPAICDQCTAPINLPLRNEMELIVKHSEETEEEDDEVVFIHPNTSHFNVAKYLYEFAVLSLPIVNTYDCAGEKERPCDMKVLEKLGQVKAHNEDSPIWDALKDFGK
jgi:uncharacterized metal-binding protein YceD (DUF177 family)